MRFLTSPAAGRCQWIPHSEELFFKRSPDYQTERLHYGRGSVTVAEAEPAEPTVRECPDGLSARQKW